MAVICYIYITSELRTNIDFVGQGAARCEIANFGEGCAAVHSNKLVAGGDKLATMGRAASKTRVQVRKLSAGICPLQCTTQMAAALFVVEAS